MQARCTALALTAAVMFIAAARAGDYTAVEVGSTGLTLHNSALPQDRHYLKQDEALAGRIATLMADVDCLLAKLHALPPELAESPAVQSPVGAEFKQLIELGLNNNPELKPLRSQLAVLAARTRQQGAMQDPDVSLMLMDTQFPMIPPDEKLMTSAEFEVSQMYESYGKRKLKRQIARWDEILNEYELKQREYELLMDITEKYYDLMSTQAQLRSLEQNVELMSIIVELAERKLAIGSTPQAAVLAAQVQLSQMEAMRIELTNLRDQQRVRLNEVLGRPADFDPAALRFDTAYPLPPQIEWDNATMIPQALALLPDYQRLEAMQTQQGLQLELARREYRPDYSLSAKYSVQPGLRGMLGAGVMFPLFTHKEDRQDAMLQEAYAMQAVTNDELVAVSTAFTSQVEDLQYELRMHGQLVDLYRSGLVPQARLSLESNIAAYAANMMDLSDLIMAQQTLLIQEQELEQNYIHILHTLTDLQVVTSGVFDPAPYLVPDLDSLGQAAAELEMPEISILPRSAELAPDEEGEFVRQLNLPASGDDDTAPVEVNTSHSHSPALAAWQQITAVAARCPGYTEPADLPKTVSQDNPPADAAEQFYAPFVPGGANQDKQ